MTYLLVRLSVEIILVPCMNTVVVTVLGLIVFWVGGVILGLVMKVLLIVWMLVATVIIQIRCREKNKWYF